METFYDEDYTGPRYTYGFRNRPAGIGCQPNGRIIGSGKQHKDFRHGTFDWPFELNEEQLYSYELTKVETETE